MTAWDLQALVAPMGSLGRVVEERPVNYDQLAEFLNALAYPVRLELLHKLRFPHTLGEIRVTTQRGYKGARADRPVARGTIAGHLDQLVAAGLVQSSEVERGGRGVAQYTVVPGRLYALMEELRRLSVIYAGRGAAPDMTGTLGTVGDPEPQTGPRLLLVHGVYEGKVYPLDETTSADGVWRIGRHEGAPVRLDYDPYVSTDNAEIRADGDGFQLVDLGSKNGTFVNWDQLEAGEARGLNAGDVIGVGWSRLVFIPA